jgi:hypothetical protein
MASIVADLRVPYQPLSEEPQLSAVRVTFPFLAHQSQGPPIVAVTRGTAK